MHSSRIAIGDLKFCFNSESGPPGQFHLVRPDRCEANSGGYWIESAGPLDPFFH